jgi:hypothetical protein
MRTRFLLAGVFACAMTLMAQNPGSVDTAVPPQAGPTSTTTLTGCLKGTTDQYFLMEKNGTRHVLVAKNRDLKPLMDHMVTVTGKADVNRDASSSSDEGSSRGNRFFQVDSVSDQGPCK